MFTLTSHFNIIDALYPLPEFVEILEHAPNTLNKH